MSETKTIRKNPDVVGSAWKKEDKEKKPFIAASINDAQYMFFAKSKKKETDPNFVVMNTEQKKVGAVWYNVFKNKNGKDNEAWNIDISGVRYVMYRSQYKSEKGIKESTLAKRPDYVIYKGKQPDQKVEDCF